MSETTSFLGDHGQDALVRVIDTGDMQVAAKVAVGGFHTDGRSQVLALANELPSKKAIVANSGPELPVYRVARTHGSGKGATDLGRRKWLLTIKSKRTANNVPRRSGCLRLPAGYGSMVVEVQKRR